ncbi:hypothetical protein BD779DRAFT_433418 [Infundibulicybe gibba]|nr:hypothetical protein BD779DRAFT_433418 [Infundibulicybe gibba]
MVLSPSKVALIGILGHSVLYGIYLVFFISALYVAYARWLRGYLKGVNMFLFMVTVILFVLITATWLMQVFQMADAFIYRIDGNPDIYYTISKDFKAVISVALNIGLTIVADSTMVYRLYLVWGRSLRVALLPLVLVVGLIGTGCMALYSLSPISQPVGKLGIFSTAISFLGVTLILNVVISGLISYRIWSINRQVSGLAAGQKTYSVMCILLANAMLYIGCVGSSLVGIILDDNYPLIVLNVAGPVIGIIFCLIIVWVGLGQDIESTSQVVSDISFRHSSGILEQNIRPRECDVAV